MPRDDRRAFAFAAGKQAFEIGHDIAALGLGRLMATLAIGLQNGPYLLKITDVCAGGLRGMQVKRQQGDGRNEGRVNVC